MNELSRGMHRERYDLCFPGNMVSPGIPFVSVMITQNIKHRITTRWAFTEETPTVLIQLMRCRHHCELNTTKIINELPINDLFSMGPRY